MIGNEASETTVVPVPAGSRVIIDVAGLHYNRKSHLAQQAHSGGLQGVTQHAIGTTHILSNQIGSWANGIRTLLSHSLRAGERASVAGNSSPSDPKPKRLTIPKFRFFEMTALGMLTTLIQRYKVEPHPKFAGESLEQLRERYSQAEGMVTLT